MSEEKERAESGPEAIVGGVDPVAVALALGGTSREDANAFLNDQRALIADQRHHLHEQFKHLHLGIWEKQLGVMLRVATMVMGLAVAGGLGFIVWEASQSNRLIIEPFSVPPDLAARGLTGEVVASRVMDRLTLLQSQTSTQRPAKSYANAWGQHGIKLEIPETGMSLLELDQWLREKLGNDTHVTGEIVHTDAGVTVTARSGEDGAETVSGPAADTDAMVGKLAEAIYRLTQPYRYAAYLLRHEHKSAEALPIFRRLALNGNPDDRLWSYNMWGVAIGDLEGRAAALEMYRRAIAADPDSIGTYDNFAGSLGAIGRNEEELQARKTQLEHLKNGRQRYIPTANIPTKERGITTSIAVDLGAWGDALPLAAQNFRTGVPGSGPLTVIGPLLVDQIGVHEISAAGAGLAAFLTDPTPGANELGLTILSARLAAARQDWKAVLPLADAVSLDAARTPKDKVYNRDFTAPILALAQAHLGDFAAAERTIGPTSAACYTCLIARAQVAELQGQAPRADAWFAQAIKTGPSIPFAHHQWGLALLARGKPDAAMAQFVLANQKGPRFADPLEGWGEALVAKNQSHLALEKFAEADKYAPNWGRLHLKWGEALYYAGKRDDARAQFARAAALDLTPSEKSELSRQP